MRRIRVIPTLLLRNGGLVKTTRFRHPVYVGDPINAVRIFNEKEVDELIMLDIEATRARRGPDMRQVAELASECFMPLAYGGGISRLEHVSALLQTGVEKVVINTAAEQSPRLVEEAAGRFGSQAVVVSVDVRRTWMGREWVYTAAGKRNTGMDPVEWCRRAQSLGAGEILLTAIHREGTFSGYDLPLLRRVSAAVRIPVVACGGGASIQDFAAAVREGGASAVAAGSMFVFNGPHRAVLISYPEQASLRDGLFGMVDTVSAA